MKKILLSFAIAMSGYCSYAQTQWTTSGANIYNLNTGNVGIGTTSPAALLTLGGAAPVIATNTADGSDTKFLKLAGGGAETGVRGAVIVLAGNEETTFFGDAILNAGVSGVAGHGKVRIGNVLIVDQPNGNIGIGTATPDQRLTVNGQVHSTSVVVTSTVPADYVFNADYYLRPLTDVEAYVDKNHHLPDVPAAADFKKDGQNLGEMNMLLLKKVEELTLYLIEKDKQLTEQRNRNDKREVRIAALEKALSKLTNK